MANPGASLCQPVAVLLAAGLSSRMGERNKLLIEIGGEALVRRSARVYLAAGMQLYVVVGHDADRVQKALKGLPATIAVNPRYSEGQASSLHAGLSVLRPGHDAVLVALADQAALTAEDIKGLLAAFASGDRTRALIPYYHGARGNPVVFPPEVVAKLLAVSGATGRNFLDAHPELTLRYDAQNNHFVTDIDTPQDLEMYFQIADQ